MNGFEKRAEEKKQQILAAAFSLMNSPKGMENLTTNKVAKLAHVSKATLFKYFTNKENLIVEVFIDFIEKMREPAFSLMEKGLSFKEVFSAMTQIKIDSLGKVEPQFYNDLMKIYTQKEDPKLAKIMEKYTQESFSLMLQIFNQGKKEGAVDEKYTDEFLIIFFQTLINGMGQPDIYQQLPPYTQAFSDIILRGLAPEK